MKQVEPGYLVVLLICLLAIWPFLSRPGLPVETDAELHVFRLAELSRLAGDGVFYPRWAPNFYFGYGYPIFNYYAPLTYYLGLPLALIPTIGPVGAVKFVFVLGLLAAGIGMYGFVRANWGRPAALVAAAVYVYAPYIHYVDPQARGDLAEAFGLGILPLALWAVDRVRRRGGAGPWLLALLLVAAIILSHNLMAMVSFALLLAWVLWQAIFRQQRMQRYALPALVAALSLGVGLTAFFWLPVALEQEAVNLSSLVGDGSHFDFRNHFLAPAELFGPSAWLDWGATEPEFALNLGLAQWLLGALGLAALITRRARHTRHAAFFAIAAMVLIGLMLAPSQFLWERVPLLPYLQFPWRLLGVTAAVLAVLAAVGTEALLRLLSIRWQRWVPALLVSYPLLLALPLAQVAPWSGAAWDTSPLAVMLIEYHGRWLGTTSTADFVPATVDAIPRPAPSLVEDFHEGVPLDRVNRETLPDVVDLGTERLNPLHTRYQISSPRDFYLRLLQFDFPGWQVRIDGEVVATDLGRPEGFLVVPVPAGEHVVDVAFVDTPARQLAWGVSALSLLLALLFAFTYYRYTRPALRAAAVAAAPDPAGSVTRVGLLAGGITLLVLLFLGPAGWLHYHSSGRIAAPASHHVYADFGGQIALVGYDAPASARPGETIEVTLYWRAQRELDINFQVFVHLLRPPVAAPAGDGPLLAQSDKLNPGEFPTRRWPQDKYVRDTHSLTIPAEIEPGGYPLATGLWVQAEGWRLPLFDEAEVQVGDHFVLQYLQIED